MTSPSRQIRRWHGTKLLDGSGWSTAQSFTMQSESVIDEVTVEAVQGKRMVRESARKKRTGEAKAGGRLQAPTVQVEQ